MIALIPVGLAASLFSGSFKLKGEVEGVTGWRWKAAVSGVVVGMYEGFFGPGSGAFFLLGIHVFLKTGLIKASGTAKIYDIFANLGAQFVPLPLPGTVAYSLAIPCAAVSIVGNRLGAKYAIRLGANIVRRVLYLVIGLLMVSIIAKVVFMSN